MAGASPKFPATLSQTAFSAPNPCRRPSDHHLTAVLINFNQRWASPLPGNYAGLPRGPAVRPQFSVVLSDVCHSFAISRNTAHTLPHHTTAMANSGKMKPLHSVRSAASIQEVWQRQADMAHSMCNTGRSSAQAPIGCHAVPQHVDRAEVPYLAGLAAQIKSRNSPRSTPASNVTGPYTDVKQSHKSPSLWCWGKRSSKSK